MNYKVGDLVRVQNKSRWCIGRVSRVTAKQVILASGGRYWKESGRMVGTSHWVSMDIISHATAEDLEENKKNKIIEQLSRSDFRVLPLATLEEWLKTVREISNEKKK